MSEAAPLFAARVIPSDIVLSQLEADTILEIAYLAIASDHELATSELAAFRNVMAKIAQVTTGAKLDPYRAQNAKTLTGGPVSDRSLNDKLDQLNQKFDRAEVDERLRELAKELSPDARKIAYKVAHAIALADMNESDAEFEFDLQLIDALELDVETSETLVDEVIATMQES